MFQLAKSLSITAALLVAAGCYAPGGHAMDSTGGPITYVSTETNQKSVRLIDLRSEQVLFAVDVPPGKQLVLNFETGDGDNEVYSPDLMRYGLMDAGKRFGALRNAMTVPPANARRLDVDVTQSIAYRDDPMGQPMPDGQVEGYPEWWTPEGGPMPEDQRGLRNYDD